MLGIESIRTETPSAHLIFTALQLVSLSPKIGCLIIYRGTGNKERQVLP